MPVSGTFVTAGVPEAFATVHVVADVEPGPGRAQSATPIYCDAITDASGNWVVHPVHPDDLRRLLRVHGLRQDEAGNTGISPDPEFGVYVMFRLPHRTASSSSSISRSWS